jgi:hypothetical protein
MSRIWSRTSWSCFAKIEESGTAVQKWGMFYRKPKGVYDRKCCVLAGAAKSVYQMYRYFERELALLVDIHVLQHFKNLYYYSSSENPPWFPFPFQLRYRGSYQLLACISTLLS